MNISTHFDYNNHITFISTHTKIDTPHKAPVPRANRSEFAELAVSNVAATFRQCPSPIVSKLSTWDKNRNLGKASW